MIVVVKLIKMSTIKLKKTWFNWYGCNSYGSLISQFGVFWLNVGDSRIYKLDQQLIQVSIDHTLVNELIRSNRHNNDQALNHPKKHHITKAIGIWEKIEIDFGKILEPAKYFCCAVMVYAVVSDHYKCKNSQKSSLFTNSHKVKGI